MKTTILSLLVAIGLIGSALAAVITEKFNYTGSYQTFTVPNGVNFIEFKLLGASGGEQQNSVFHGGFGGSVMGLLSVTSGEALYFYIGGMGIGHQGGFNGGGDGFDVGFGGGGATDVRIGGVELTNRFIVAGGGGGSCASFSGGNSPSGYYDPNGNLGDRGYNQILGLGSSGETVDNGSYYFPSYYFNGGGGGGGYYGGNIMSGGQCWVDTSQVSSYSISTAPTEGNGYASISYTAVPEPSTYALLVLGLLALVVWRRKVA